MVFDNVARKTLQLGVERFDEIGVAGTAGARRANGPAGAREPAQEYESEARR